MTAMNQNPKVGGTGYLEEIPYPSPVTWMLFKFYLRLHDNLDNLFISL